MAISTQPQKAAELTGGASNGALPPLENGDRLTRAEFERRYDAMPHLKKAELIEGEVYMPSPVRHAQHGHPHTRLVTWLGMYETDTPGVEAGDNGSVRLDMDNEPQPDGYLIILPERGGQARISEDDYIEGCAGAGGRGRVEQRQLRPGKEVERLPALRRARVRRLASARPPGRLVREPRRAIRAAARPRPTASCAARCFQGSGSIPSALVNGEMAAVKADPRARPEVSRARRVRGPPRTHEQSLNPRSA